MPGLKEVLGMRTGWRAGRTARRQLRQLLASLLHRRRIDQVRARRYARQLPLLRKLGLQRLQLAERLQCG